MNPKRIALVSALAAAVLLAACGDPESGGSEPAADECPDDVVTTDSGLQYKDLECGDGDEAQAGDRVTVHYTGTLEDGTKFDSSRDRDEPFPFTLGAGAVIAGWDEGIEGMAVGTVRELTIPPELGYGEGGFPPTIPPNATLIFEVELLEVASSSP